MVRATGFAVVRASGCAAGAGALDVANGGAIGAATGGALDVATGGAIGAATGGTLDVATGGAIGAASGALDVATGGALDDVDAGVIDLATGAATGGATRAGCAAFRAIDIGGDATLGATCGVVGANRGDDGRSGGLGARACSSAPPAVAGANGTGVSARITRCSGGGGSISSSGNCGGRSAVTTIITTKTSAATATQPARM